MKLQAVRNRIKQYVYALRHRLIDYFYHGLCKWDYHLQGNPRWIQSNFGGATHATYWGECRLCNARITPEYRFRDLMGPIYDNIPTTYKGYRDLEVIISNTVRLFLKDNK